jgi:hypothetical protein
MVMKMEMTRKQEVLEGLKDYNVYKLEIDRDAELKGNPATKYCVFMNNPKGINTGKLMSEFYIADINKMSTEDLVKVFKSYINASIPEWEIEVEK